jgi:hypothetical protein
MSQRKRVLPPVSFFVTLLAMLALHFVLPLGKRVRRGL